VGVTEDNPGSGDGSNPEWGNCHLESGNLNPDSGNSNPGKENDRQGEEPVPMDINMVFTIPAEFHAPTEDVFEKPENPGAHMKPLFIWGHLDEASTSCRCRYSRSLATLKVILNVQILALAVLQVIRWRQKE
jgi:hypothetical protein